MNNITPNLFLIGGMRCGSTSLHLLFDQHDQINMSAVKEPGLQYTELTKKKVLDNSTEELKADLNKFISSGDH